MVSIKIGIIDNGVDKKSLFSLLQHEIIVNEDGFHAINSKYTNNIDHDFNHGTICSLIIQKNCPTSSISSIKILDNMGNGKLDNIEPALEWCFQNEIYLVNLSLGTTCHSDKNKLKQVINMYAKKGMIIIAATSNSDYVSFPASFTNVIGVAAGNRPNKNEWLTVQKGVDLEVAVNPKIESKTDILDVSISNSYAAPYVTALVANILSVYPKINLFTLKQYLTQLYNNEIKDENLYYSPDWIVSAWIDREQKINGRINCFKIYSGDYQQHSPKIDTIIFYNFANYKKYLKTDKHLLYFGEEKLSFHPTDRFYWDRYKQAYHIIYTEKRKSELEIPIIVCLVDEQINLLPLLAHLKEQFQQDNYQVYAISNLIESVLFDLEYIPSELLYDNLEKLCDFLYWQTYCLQSDVLLIGLFSTRIQHFTTYLELADMVVTLNCLENIFQIKIQCDGETQIQDNIEKIDTNILYQDIIRLFMEDDDGN